MLDVSIIIVNYNTLDLIKSCIDSIRKYVVGVSYEIIVVDNDSTESIAPLKEDKQIKLIENQQNLGFGRANNVGVAQARGRYLFFLNSDTLLLDDVVSDFVALLDERKDIGAVGCLLLGEEGNVIHSGGAFRTPKSMLLHFLGHDYDRYVESRIAHDTLIPVDYVTGADLFMSASNFKAIGGFDENIFMYNEDSDLQVAISKMGLKRVLLAKKSIMHLCGASFKKKASFYKYFISLKSLKYYSYKHFSGISYACMYFTVVVSNMKNLLQNLRNFSFKDIVSAFFVSLKISEK